MQSPCRLGIDLFQRGKQCRAALGFKLFPQLATQVFRTDGSVRKGDIFNERLQIQSRAAAQNGELSSFFNLRDSTLGVLNILRDAVGGGQRQKAQKVVRYPLHFRRRRTRRADGDAVIDLHGVGGNDLPVKTLCHFHCEGGFSGSGRTGNHGI